MFCYWIILFLGLNILSNGVMTVYDWNDGWGTLVERGFGIESPTGLLSTFDRDYQYEQNIGYNMFQVEKVMIYIIHDQCNAYKIFLSKFIRVNADN